MRVLGRVRLSRFSDESTSVERQREIIAKWAADNDHTVVGYAEDVDVSRSVDPFDTPALGPWFTPEQRGEWDIVACWKLDRIATGSIYLNKVMAWCGEHEKSLVSVTENFDLGTWVGRLIANVIAGVAEGELEAIRERTQASRRKLVAVGRWTGGRPTYGYRAVEQDGGGWTLEPDPESSAILRRIVDRALAGESTLSIVRGLNDEGVLSPADYVRYRNGKPTLGAKWTTTATLDLMRSRTLLGQIVHNGAVVRDDSGKPVLGGPPLIDYDTFTRLQAALDARSRTQKVERVDASPLLGVAVCWECGSNLFHQRQMNRGKPYRYYKCPNKCSQAVKADDAEAVVEDMFLDKVGGHDELERVFIPGADHSTELREAQEAVDELTKVLGTMSSNTVRTAVLGQLEALDKRIQELECLPLTEARVELQPTGRLYRDAWGSLDSDGRRELLVKAGITARLKVEGRPVGGRAPGAFYFDLVVPEDLRERMSL
ncbi:serine integrase [Mycobacterium phage Timshel]|uniref:Serine integrase n=1 Tax=Mycobacterium phage Timshel TaxID=1032895 RepID=G1DB52_9CAUD|nr:integrase [Mycobacterium phage Timshel]AEJ92399.1 serine integrase [Mycobacterium phage Timshel]